MLMYQPPIDTRLIAEQFRDRLNADFRSFWQECVVTYSAANDLKFTPRHVLV